jgi:hypothetical protein
VYFGVSGFRYSLSGNSPKVMQLPLLIIEQLAGDRPVLVRWFIENDASVRLGFVRNAFQGIGDLFGNFGFLFAAGYPRNT